MVKIDLKKTAALWGCIYLFLTIGPFMFWLLPLSLFLAVSLGVIFVITLKLWRIGQLVLTKDRVFLFVLFLLYIIHLSLPLWGHSFDWSKIFIFSPLLCIIFWEDCIYYRLFRLFRKWMIFFSFFSIVVFILFALGATFDTIPHYEIDGGLISIVKRNVIYYVYGPVVIASNCVYPLLDVIFVRACGPFLEPGHLAIILGFIIAIENILYQKYSIILLICGFLTFSPAFYIIFILICLYNIYYNCQRKYLFYLLGILLSIGIIIMLLPETIKEYLWYIIMERRFENTSGDMLDSRSGSEILRKYNVFINSADVFMGRGVADMDGSDGFLSDYRGFVYSYGIWGMLLFVLIQIGIFLRVKLRIVYLFSMFVLLVLLHRAWMLGASYLFLLVLLAVHAYSYYNSSPKNIIK